MGCGGAEAGGSWGRGYLFSLPPTFLPSCFCIGAKFLHCSCHRHRLGQSSCSELDHWRFVFLTLTDTQVWWSLFILPLGGQAPARHSIGLSSQDEPPTVSLFSMGKYHASAGFSVQSLYLPSICEEMLLESGIELSQALCLKRGQEVFRDFGSFVLMYLGWGKPTLDHRD